MRLIDADALIAQMAADAEHMEEPVAKMFTFAAINDIKHAPTIEPKKGEWIPITKGERGYSAGDFRCSVCHQPNKCYTMTNYCSHCGAYMKPTEKTDQ